MGENAISLPKKRKNLKSSRIIEGPKKLEKKMALICLDIPMRG
jgi:hypothetical protein